MDVRELITTLVPRVTRNAAVVRIDEDRSTYRVTIAGTTGLVAGCEVTRETVDAALERADARARLESVLKTCADRTVAEVPDARG